MIATGTPLAEVNMSPQSITITTSHMREGYISALEKGGASQCFYELNNQ